ncbi:MAG TPA: histidine--tRNA ligase [Thermoplasmata archaeon]|nr:histidine--tRNA ligase [Thermoplasmata archaeon]
MFTSLRGFRDYPPPEGGARSEIRRRMRAAARRAGFTELEVPSIESLDLYQVKSGEEITKQTWTFSDKGGRPVALASETTPSVVRVYVDRAKSEPLPAKWFTISKTWRYEEPQMGAGRTREFLQFNLDIFGVPGVEADADLLAAACLVLDEVGAQELYTIRVNDRALAEGIGRLYGAADLGRFFQTVDRFRKTSPADFESGLAAAGVGPRGARELAAQFTEVGAGLAPKPADEFLRRWVDRGLDLAARKGVERLQALLGLLDRAGLRDRIVFDPTVVRGLAYYTSTVFEAFARTGEIRSVFGGGRYDHLVELFGGPPTPVTGLAIGDQTLEILLRDAGRWPDGEPGVDTYVVVVDPSWTPEAVGIVQELRRAGVSADCDLLARSMSRQLKEAARRRCRRALIVGLKEATPGAVVERDLATGAQRELARDAAVRPG